MLPIETKLSVPIEGSSLQSITLPDGNQSQMCLLPSNLYKHISSKQYHHRNGDHHIPSALIHEYITPFESKRGINNKMMPFEYYLKLGQYVDNKNGHCHQILPFLNPSCTSLDPSVPVPTFNAVSMTQTTEKMQLSEFNSSLKNISDERSLSAFSIQKSEYENFIQPCSVTNQQDMLTQSYSLPIASSSSIPTSFDPLSIRKRKYTRRARAPLLEQHLFQCPNTSAKPIYTNCWSSLPLPSKINALVRPDECKFPADLTRTSNFAPLPLPDFTMSSDSPSTITDNNLNPITVQQDLLPHSTTNIPQRYQTSEQCLSDKKFGFMQKTINNCSTNNLSYNLPHFLSAPYGHYYMLPSNPMSINIPPIPCSSLLPELNTTFPHLSFPNNMKKVRKKREVSRNSKAVQNPTVEVLMDEKTVVPIRRRRLQKKSKIKDNQTKTLIKRMKQRNKLVVLKFMRSKRKQQQQQISKKKLSEVKIEKVVPDMVDSNVSKTVEMEAKLADIIAPNLKITFNADQKIESISLYYHQRRKSVIKTEHSFITSNNTENKLGLLIEAIKFIEMHNDSSKLTLESIE